MDHHPFVRLRFANFEGPNYAIWTKEPSSSEDEKVEKEEKKEERGGRLEERVKEARGSGCDAPKQKALQDKGHNGGMDTTVDKPLGLSERILSDSVTKQEGIVEGKNGQVVSLALKFRPPEKWLPEAGINQIIKSPGL